MSLTFTQYARLYFLDVPEMIADANSMTMVAMIEKWGPRLQAYGVLGNEPVITSKEALKRIGDGEVPPEVIEAVNDRSGGNLGSGGG